jgi:predicted nuclease with RNAse H fold
MIGVGDQNNAPNPATAEFRRKDHGFVHGTVRLMPENGEQFLGITMSGKKLNRKLSLWPAIAIWRAAD